jgi:hypothetical protein
MNDTTRGVFRLAPDITPEQAKDARARAWEFIFDCHAKKKAARPGGPDDGTKSKEDSANAPIIQK